MGRLLLRNLSRLVTVPSHAARASDTTFNTEFWSLAHHSTFLGPGWRHIGTTVQEPRNGNLCVHVVAYGAPDHGDVVLVVANFCDSDNATLEVSCDGRGFRFSFPHGVATFSWSCRDSIDSAS